jgi:hypothetical protein
LDCTCGWLTWPSADSLTLFAALIRAGQWLFNRAFVERGNPYIFMKNTFTIRSLVSVVLMPAALAVFCTSDVAGADHAHKTPHGGTPVLVANHKFHLELVRDGAAGLIQAYVLDDALKKSVAVRETNFTLRATFAGRSESVDFKRAQNVADKKLPAASSLFEARAEWIKSAKNFNGVIPAITLNGQSFTNITFPFPKGTQHTH